MSIRDQTAFIERWGAPILSGLVFVSVAVLLYVARGAVRSSPRFQVDPLQVAVEERPAWLPAGLAVELGAQLGRELEHPASLLEEEDLARWRSALPEVLAWVESVEHVEARFPAQAEVRLRLRRPVLELPGELLYSSDGVPLGRGRMDTDPPLLRFEGFGDESDVRECAASAADLLPFRAELADQGLFVDRILMGSGGRVRFLTTAGVELEWGRSSTLSEFSAVDVPPRTRVGHLLTVLDRRPGLHGVARVILWKDQPEVILESTSLPVAPNLPRNG